jgi:hypothetical protein
MAVEHSELGTDSRRMACGSPFCMGDPGDRAFGTVWYRSRQHGWDHRNDTEFRDRLS